MTLAQLFLQAEAAYACVRELGELVRLMARGRTFMIDCLIVQFEIDTRVTVAG